MKKLLTSGFIVPVVTTFFACAVLLYCAYLLINTYFGTSFATPSMQFPKFNYSTLIISKDGVEVGSIKHTDQKLSFVSDDAVLKSYLASTLPRLQEKSLEYPYGNCNRSGCWDGVVTTNKQKSDFLIGVMIVLEEDVAIGKKYKFDLKE